MTEEVDCKVKKSAVRRLFARIVILERQLKTNQNLLVVVFLTTLFLGILGFVADIDALFGGGQTSLRQTSKNDFEVKTEYYSYEQNGPEVTLFVKYKKGFDGFWQDDNLTYYVSYDGKNYKEADFASVYIRESDLLLSDKVYLKIKDDNGYEVGPWEYEMDYTADILKFAQKAVRQSDGFLCETNWSNPEYNDLSCYFSFGLIPYTFFFDKLEYSFNSDYSNAKVVDFEERELKEMFHTPENLNRRSTIIEADKTSRELYYRIYFFDGTQTDWLSQKLQ